MRQYFFTNSSSTTNSTFIKTNGQKAIVLKTGNTILRSVTFPFSFHSINSNNNTFTLLENATTLTITMTPGNYDSVSFCTMLKAQLESASAAGETYTLTINDSTGLLTISTVATNISMRLASYSKAARILGFSASDVAATTTSITSSYPVQLLCSKIYLCIPQIAEQFESQEGAYASPKVLTIPLNVNPYSVVHYEPLHLSWDLLARFTYLEIYFVDENDDVINWNKGIWSIEIVD